MVASTYTVPSSVSSSTTSRFLEKPARTYSTLLHEHTPFTTKRSRSTHRFFCSLPTLVSCQQEMRIEALAQR